MATQAVPPPAGAKIAAPAAKPVPATPVPPARPVVSKPPAAAPAPKAPPAVAPPARVKAPPSPEPVGTQVFAGLHAPKVEALITEVKQDGSLGKSVRILKETTIGHGTCDLSYPSDALLSPLHASLAIREGKLFLRDLESQNGTFLKQRQDAELTPGDVFLLGRELFRFTTQAMEDSQGPAAAQGTQIMVGTPKLPRGPVTAKLERIQLSGEVIEEFKLDKPEITLGRTKGDLVFKKDPFMSGTHARIVAQPGRFLLQDLKSRNGIYRRMRNEAELRDGDEFFLGEQLFRATIKVS
jgi:pSer/pThr/pTyr-binding forkhead associated (FHA) protein